MIRYAITEERGRLPGTNAQTVDYVQLRAKSLDSGELLAIAMKLVAELGSGTKLLVSGRCDVSVAAGAAGVHLTGAQDELTAAQVRRVFTAASRPKPVVSVSCHSVAEVQSASAAGVDLILFGPVFEKRVGGEIVVGGVGLQALQAACKAAAGVKVLALGGVTESNSGSCMEAGAAGIAGIRLFA